MKLITFLIMFLSLGAAAQDGDVLVGKWLKMNKEDLIIEIVKDQGTYKGKIAWSKDGSKPLGYQMLDKLTYNQKEHTWENGKIHDPTSGRSYNAKVKLNANGTIEVTGKLFLFSSSRLFKRVK